MGNVDGDGSSAGEVVDVFTSQAGRVEVTLITSTYTMLFSTMKLIIAAISCLQVDVFTAAAFICLLPVMYSNDDLTKRATEGMFILMRLNRLHRENDSPSLPSFLFLFNIPHRKSFFSIN